ncbi:MAG TPA: TonB-dependent receptor [Candidatus Sulfotelmatobacter sp.]|nr:TonB-dependent receptor [Candidatus Sulfotelmatobacter sp.]
MSITRAARALGACGILIFSLVTVLGAPARADVVGAVRGTLTRPDHQPIANALVTLTGPSVRQTARTDATGHFAFPAVPFGRYTLHADTPAGPAELPIEVATGTTLEVALLAAPTIGHTVVAVPTAQGPPPTDNTVTASQIATLPANTTIDRVIETLPGVVRFSYDEPVVDGFHGVTYELDGAPLPSSTSSNFANLVDPREADAIEVFTGDFPAEFGGQRMGAVVNVRSLAFANPPPPGVLILGAGNLGTDDAELIKQFSAGKFQVSLALDNLETDRGLDTPAEDALHDATSTANQFLRIGYAMGAHDTLALDAASQYATYQIPINTDPNDLNAGQVSLPNQDDVQREYDRFLALSYTHQDLDGNGYFRVVPWTRYNRVVYDGDLDADVQGYIIGTAVTPQSCPVPVVNGFDCPSNGLFQDRSAAYVGLRLIAARSFGQHTLTYGVDLQQEDFDSNVAIAFAPAENPFGPAAGPFLDVTAQRGTNTGAYVEDVWEPSPYLTIKPGIRYDHSTGYVSGEQVSPRFEIDQQIAPATVASAYVGRYYAAPGLEDTRREAVITDTSPTANPIYDLQPERDTMLQVGIAHDFGAGRKAWINAYDRTVVNVLDTTNLLNTPLFAVYNSAIGVTRGIDGRYQQSSRTTDVGVSFTYSLSLAGGVSGGTFLFPPPDVSDLTLEPEDHDETYTGDAYVTRHFGPDLKSFVTLETQYGSGFPVAFLNGTGGRLPAHYQENLAVGRAPVGRYVGYEFRVDNLLDHRWLIKVDNGFNTTQWNAPLRAEFRLLIPW